MDKFLGISVLPELNQDEINYLNIPIISSEIEAVIQKSLNWKSPGPDGFRAEFYQTAKEVMPTLLKLFCKTKTAGTLPNSFYKATITIAKIIQRGNNKKRKL